MRQWKGAAGVQHLIQIAGTAPVEVMVAFKFDQTGQTIPTFGGDMEHLQLLDCSFSSFLDGTLLADLKARFNAESSAETTSPGDVCLYLAQCPISIWETETKTGDRVERQGPLSALGSDFTIPTCIPVSRLTQTNLWANLHAMRSSLHYDPYNNLLCVIQGQKKVRVAPPRSFSRMGLHPVCDESANHATGDLWSMGTQVGAKEFIVRSGDGLYIPEGWIHQVESDSGTIAINFWWKSSVTMHFGSEMDSYYLRRLISNRISTVRLEILKEACARSYVRCLESRDKKRCSLREQGDGNIPSRLLSLEASTEIIDPQLCSEEKQFLERILECIGPMFSNAEGAVGDSSDSLMCHVEPLLLALLHKGAISFIRVLINLRNSFPRLTFNLLERSTPLMWEALTIGLEHSIGMDDSEGSLPGVSSENVLSSFYEHLYSCVDDRFYLTKIMLRAKAEAAQNAFQRVCTTELGLNFDKVLMSR